MRAEATICANYINPDGILTFEEALTNSLTSSDFWYGFRCAEDRYGTDLRPSICDYEIQPMDEDGLGSGSKNALVVFFFDSDKTDLDENEKECMEFAIQEDLIGWDENELIDIFGSYLREDVDEDHNAAWEMPEIWLEDFAVIYE